MQIFGKNSLWLLGYTSIIIIQTKTAGIYIFNLDYSKVSKLNVKV